MVSTTQRKRDSRLYLTQNIPVPVWAGFKIQMCGSSLRSIFYLPHNEMRLSADPNIPKNVVLFKSQNQTHLWALQLRPSSERWLLTLAYLFRLCWQPRQRSKGLVLLFNLNSAYVACYKMRDIIIWAGQAYSDEDKWCLFDFLKIRKWKKRSLEKSCSAWLRW